MELYILDSQFRRNTVIDRFESLIWTERFNKVGEFTLELDSTPVTRSLFKKNDKLALNRSNRVMVVETIETTQKEGRNKLKITGKSLESIFEDRLVVNPLAENLHEKPVWALSGTAKSIVDYIFTEVCVNNTRTPLDNLPFYDVGNFYPVDSLPEPSEEIVLEIGIGSLLSAFEEICDGYDLGFRLVRHPVTNLLYFNVYPGSDRSSGQSTLGSVIFSPDLDNLKESTQFVSIEDTKNVAYVFNNKTGMHVVYADGFDDSLSGFERKVLYLDATSIELETTDPDYMAVVEQYAKIELAKYRQQNLMDGEIPQSTIYQYEKEYFLGDIVDIINEDGITNRMRVTEQIFVEDSEGERDYPTLEVERRITPGSWEDWRYNIEWEDAIGTWEDQTVE